MNDRVSTQAVHAGESRRKPYGALTTPIVQTSTYTFADTAEILDFMERKAAGETDVRDEYGRYSNPTQKAAEAKIAALEGAERALLFSSGMSAITTTLAALLSGGDHLILGRECYRRTADLAESYLARWGIETTMVSIGQPDEFAAAIRPTTRLILAETPTNPYLRVLDLDRVARLAREQGVLTMVDSTFATPVNLRPLEHGFDLVMHSASKYLAGHNDVLAGAIAGASEILAKIETCRGVMGTTSNPNDSYLLLRGLKTLELRVLRQNESGQRVAEFLQGHPAVAKVHYPGLASHPDFDVARRQMTGFGGVVSFEIQGDWRRTGDFVDRLRLPYIGPTLGGVESIIQQQALLFSLDPAEQKRAGLGENLLRYALGVENVEDLIADLEQALAGL